MYSAVIFSLSLVFMFFMLFLCKWVSLQNTFYNIVVLATFVTIQRGLLVWLLSV